MQMTRQDGDASLPSKLRSATSYALEKTFPQFMHGATRPSHPVLQSSLAVTLRPYLSRRTRISTVNRNQAWSKSWCIRLTWARNSCVSVARFVDGARHPKSPGARSILAGISGVDVSIEMLSRSHVE